MPTFENKVIYLCKNSCIIILDIFRTIEIFKFLFYRHFKVYFFIMGCYCNEGCCILSMILGYMCSGCYSDANKQVY